MKKFILNADGLGMSKGINRGIIEGYDSGFLKRASVAVNGESFEEGINSVISSCPDLKLGLHLNLTYGKGLNPDAGTLLDPNGMYNNTFWSLLFKTYNPKDKVFLEEVEAEIRLQIEKLKSRVPNITHIDSHEHIHAIPPIFEIVCKLAKEYEIREVRTHYEKLYIVPDIYKHLKLKYLKNIGKTFILNLFTLFNENIVRKCGLLTNDYLNGVLYDGMADALTVSYGIPQKNFSNIIIEAVIHPARYEEGIIDNGFDEYMITKNKKLQEKIKKLGFEISDNYEKET